METDTLKRKQNVLKVQKWRMRIRLEEKEKASNKVTHDLTKSAEDGSAEVVFGSRSTEHRAVKRAKAGMPATPRRKSRILEKLIESPRTCRYLEKKGVIMSNYTRKTLRFGDTVMNNIKTKIKDVKLKKGGTPKDSILQCFAVRIRQNSI